MSQEASEWEGPLPSFYPRRLMLQKEYVLGQSHAGRSYQSCGGWSVLILGPQMSPWAIIHLVLKSTVILPFWVFLCSWLILGGRTVFSGVSFGSQHCPLCSLWLVENSGVPTGCTKAHPHSPTHTPPHTHTHTPLNPWVYQDILKLRDWHFSNFRGRRFPGMGSPRLR